MSSGAVKRQSGASTVVRIARTPNTIVALYLPATESAAAVVTLDLCVRLASAGSGGGGKPAEGGGLLVKSMAREPTETAAKTLDRIRLLFAPPRGKGSAARRTTREDMLADCPPITAYARATGAGGAAAPEVLDTDLPNSEFWARVGTIAIGAEQVAVRYNLPTITSISPPSKPFVGLPLVCSNITCVFADASDVQYEWCLRIVDEVTGEEGVTVLSREAAFVPTPDLLGKSLVLHVTADTAAGLWTHVELAPVQPQPPPVARWAETTTGVAFPAFRVVTYNILYDDFCTSQSSKSKIYPFATDEVLDIENRRVRILQELLAYHADLVCLQECGKNLFHSYLLPAMAACGFDGLYVNKSGSVQEGCGFLFRKERFTLVASEWVPLNWETLEARDPALAAEASAHAELKEALTKVTSIGAVLTLRESGSGKELVLGNTHLFYHANACHIRILQTYLLLACLQRAAAAPGLAEDGTHGTPPRPRPIVLCGDCNFTHATGAYRLVTTGQVEDTHRSWEKGRLFWWGCDRRLGYGKEQLAGLMGMEGGPEEGDGGEPGLAQQPNGTGTGTGAGTGGEASVGPAAQETALREPLATFFRRDLHAPLRLADAYGRTDPSLPWTNFTLTFREVIDYIFFTEDSLDVLRTVPIPRESELAENYALPNAKYPSDHVALISDLAFK